MNNDLLFESVLDDDEEKILQFIDQSQEPVNVVQIVDNVGLRNVLSYIEKFKKKRMIEPTGTSNVFFLLPDGEHFARTGNFKDEEVQEIFDKMSSLSVTKRIGMRAVASLGGVTDNIDEMNALVNHGREFVELINKQPVRTGFTKAVLSSTDSAFLQWRRTIKDKVYDDLLSALKTFDLIIARKEPFYVLSSKGSDLLQSGPIAIESMSDREESYFMGLKGKEPVATVTRLQDGTFLLTHKKKSVTFHVVKSKGSFMVFTKAGKKHTDATGFDFYNSYPKHTSVKQAMSNFR
jgi:hypothetical protein